ncbi:MAG: hypothetical protein FJW96_04105 [Actinobacteria bacterium]|nr:hypothetical protein [Actinomycetota bacterium]
MGGDPRRGSPTPWSRRASTRPPRGASVLRAAARALRRDGPELPPAVRHQPAAEGHRPGHAAPRRAGGLRAPHARPAARRRRGDHRPRDRQQPRPARADEAAEPAPRAGARPQLPRRPRPLAPGPRRPPPRGRSTLNIGRRGVVLHAISAIDIALWDLHARRLGVPLYDLLGGRMRRSLPAYASWLYATEDLDALAREAAGWVAQGFTAVKQRLPYGPADGRRGIARNVELVRTVTEAVGPDVEVMADAYMSWDPGYAIRAIRAIEDAGIRLRWIEEPVIPDDVAGLARVRAAVGTPVAAGEHEATRYGFRELVTAGAVDVLQPDVNRLGGITEARRVWALGEAFGLDVVPHLGFAHNAHLAITSLATPYLEYMPPPPPPDEDQIFWVAFPDEPRAIDGRLAPAGTPGLGVTFDRAVAEPVP